MSKEVKYRPVTLHIAPAQRQMARTTAVSLHRRKKDETCTEFCKSLP